MPSGPGSARLPARPRLKPTIEVVRPGDGNVYLLHPSGESDLVIEGAGGPVERFLQSLDGARGLDELLAGGAPVGQPLEWLERLDELGLLEDAASDEVLGERRLERLDRQLRYFGDLARPGVARAEYQQRLARSTVAVLGLGGLGSWTALALACVGIGRLVLVDGDVVEPSNFNRQVLYRERDIGAPKASAAARTLRAFDSELELEAIDRRLESPADIRAVVAGADLVVDAADWPAHLIERWVNKVCFELGLPYMTMSHFPPIARVGPLYVPGETGCFECLEARLRDEFPLFDRVVEQRIARPSPTGTFGPACGLIGSWVAVEVVHRLSGIAPAATTGAARIVDLRTMSQATDAVPSNPGCPVCGGAHEP